MGISGLTTAHGSQCAQRRANAPRKFMVVFVCAFLALLAVPSGVIAQGSQVSPAPFPAVIGITIPNRQATISAVEPGRLAWLAAEEGEFVAAAALVFRLEDGVQQARARIARSEAESSLQVELAQTRWEHARREQAWFENLFGDDSASSKELMEARANAQIAQLEYQRAIHARTQAQLAQEREEQSLRLRHAFAPFDGYVARRLKEVGETVNENEGVMTLVQLDPLLVTVDCPLELASRVRLGGQAVVRPVDAYWPPRTGDVIFVSRVADGASQTFRVKLQVDNGDERWMSGLKVAVEFTGEPAPSLVGDASRGHPTPAPNGSSAHHARTSGGRPADH